MDVWFILLVGGFILFVMLVLVQLYTRDFMPRLLPWTGQRNVQDFDPGLKGYDKVQIAEEDTDSQKKKTITYELQPGKRPWDWLQLLLIPFVLAFVAYAFNSYQASTSQQIEEKSKQEQVVDNYLNQMSTILLQYHLHDSKPGDPIRALAQAFTLTALDRLDSEHKNMIILFLYRADLLKYHYYKHNETECGDPKVLKKQFPDEKPIITLSQGHIEGVTINNLGLSCIDLHNMEMEGANFSESDLNRADLGLSFAMNADFSYTSMIAANLYFLDLENANLQEAHLQFANMEGICLSHARLDGANLQHADLKVYHHLISQTVLYCGQYLTSSGILDNRPTPIPANLSGAVLTNANLTGAYLNGADLADANLSGANLTGANLSGADLTDANLSGANLTGANLSGADLTFVDLAGANLSHVKVSPEQLAKAKLHTGSIIPNASKRP